MPPGDRACNPGMCPDLESNLGPFSLQANTEPNQLRRAYHFLVYRMLLQPTETHQPGLNKERERERETWMRNINQLPPAHPLLGIKHTRHRPGLCPHQFSNPKGLGVWEDTEPPRQG
ncbi:hypothetical protein MDA_GLEAN10016041 [Myotis davidii]|uniref:Uncharacterized protein n=1 Tax=Myotis davidii TaxID=225400 RepID=L5M936_MYODS|nr:hypothetical protein MDA_GLEAN10016041 [Myotis davidii]